MDLICLILATIDIFKPSMALNIVSIVWGFIETILLVSLKKRFSISYIAAWGAIIIGVVQICIM